VSRFAHSARAAATRCGRSLFGDWAEEVIGE
jgi:hypothetical protein